MFKKGFTLVEIMVVVAIIGILAGIAYPNYVKQRERAYEEQKKSNISMVAMAKERLVIDRSLSDGDPVVFNDIKPYMGTINTEADLEVQGTTMNIGAVGVKPSY